MAATENFHLCSLEKLCRVCGDLLSKKMFNAINMKDDLKDYIFIDISKDEDHIHPKKVCLRCWSKVKNIKQRGSTTKHSNFEFLPHAQLNCTICERTKQKSKGGRKKISKPKNHHVVKALWTRDDISSLIASVIQFKDFPDDFRIPQLENLDMNPQIESCYCHICQKIMSKPVMAQCQHSTCLNCMVKHLEGFKKDSTKCPAEDCNEVVQDLKPSQMTYAMIMLLRIPCMKNCGRYFNSMQLNERHGHQAHCIGKENNLVNENNVYKYLRKEMEKSNLPNKAVKLKTGGPKVRFKYNIQNI